MTNDNKKMLTGILVTAAIFLVIIGIIAVCFGNNSNKNGVVNNTENTYSTTNSATADTTSAVTTVTGETASNINAAESSLITADKAKEIALEDAGLAKTDTVNLTAHKDIDNGVTVYEIDFQSGGYEYDYDINAETGEIIERNKEKID